MDADERAVPIQVRENMTQRIKQPSLHRLSLFQISRLRNRDHCRWKLYNAIRGDENILQSRDLVIIAGCRMVLWHNRVVWVSKTLSTILPSPLRY